MELPQVITTPTSNAVVGHWWGNETVSSVLSAAVLWPPAKSLANRENVERGISCLLFSSLHAYCCFVHIDNAHCSVSIISAFVTRSCIAFVIL